MTGLQAIGPERAAELMREGAVLIDIREADEHARERIPGARHHALSRIDAEHPARTGDDVLVFPSSVEPPWIVTTAESSLVIVPTAALVTLDVYIAEISQPHILLREPTVERHRVLCFDVNDAGSELLSDQRTDKRAEMACQRTGSAADEGRGTLIRTFHDVLLAGGIARQGGIAMSSAMSIDARSNRLNYPQRDIVRHGIE